MAEGDSVIQEACGAGVSMVTILGTKGVTYMVKDGDNVVWATKVEGFRDWRSRRAAALEQEEVAAKLAGPAYSAPKRAKTKRRTRKP